MQIPRLSPSVPQRGNRLTRSFGRFVLQLGHWRFAGSLPDLPCFVMIVVPHTSNWDFVVGVAAKLALGLDVHWLGKHTLFQGPWRGLLIWLRGIPVNRKAPHGLIGQMAHRLRESERFVLALAPEGTRSKVAKWKTGFYFMAMQAGVPIVPAYLDYGKKEIGFFPPFEPSGDLDADLARLREQYARVTAKYPEKA